MDKPDDSQLITQLLKENKELRRAGGFLAERAMYTVTEFDGLHRLALAVSNWAKTVANEGNRGNEKKIS